MKKILLVTVLLALAAIFSAIFSKSGANNVPQQISYWRQKLTSEVPVGSPKDYVLLWAKNNSVDFVLDVHRNTLFANVGRVPDTGIGFPCSEWNILIDLTLGRDNKVSTETVHSAGSCL